jgi:hypothetical protein
MPYALHMTAGVLRDRCVAAMDYSARSGCLVALHSLFSRRPASSGSISAYDCRDGGRLLFSRTAFMCVCPARWHQKHTGWHIHTGLSA